MNKEYGFGESAKYTDIGGSSSLNLLVCAADKQYVARVYRPYVTAARFYDIFMIREKLIKSGLPCSISYKNLNGQDYVMWNGRIVEVEHFVIHDAIMDTMDRFKIALPYFGKTTSVLGEIDNISFDGKNPLFSNHIHFEKIAEMTEKGCNRILNWNPTESEVEIVNTSKILAEQVLQAGESLISKLPRQMAHGDFWDNNILFYHNQLSLIVDFDFMGERIRVEDIALTLYFAHISQNFCTSEYPSRERAVELKKLLNLYESGLDVKLSEAEKIAVPMFIAVQAFWGIGGWVVLLDDEKAARNHAAGMMWELERCKYIMDNLDKWQDIFCR